MRIFGLIVYFIIIIAVVTGCVIFATDNAYFITLKFHKWQTPQAPLWVIVFGSFLLGYLVATLIFSWKLIKLSLSRKKYINSYEKIKAVLQQKMEDFKDHDEHNG